MSEKELQIPKGKDYAIRPQTPEEKERLNPDDSSIPEYKISLKTSEEQEKRLVDQFFLEFESLKNERADLGLEKKWQERDNQYDGEVNNDTRLLFNLHVFQSKIKVDAIVRATAESFLGNGQIADISPRPEMAHKDGYAVCDKQTDFLDYVMDEEIKPETDIRKIAKCAAKKFVGIGKLSWEYSRERRKREETYEGKNVIVGTINGQPVINNEGLQQFLNTYPDAQETQKGYIKRLIEEKKVNIVVEYNDTINNNAKLKYVKLEDFYVRNGCNYWEGLRTEHCVVEREEYTFWELMKKQKDEEFKDVEQLWSDAADGKGDAKDYMTKDYKVLKATIYFKLNVNDEEETKLQAWFGEDKKTFLGAILFPWYALDTEYIPFYYELNDYGFYGDARSIMYTLKDSNIAQDVLLNLLLHGTYARNVMTPIVKAGSEIEAMILDKTWQEGTPMPVEETSQDVSKELGFVQYPNMDTNGMLATISFSQRIDSNVTGVNDAAATGQNDPSDPTAPASKTIALLQQSGINIKDYIATFLPSFNIFITGVFQLYYQMNQEGSKYKVRRKSEATTGTDVFATITRDELVAKTNVQARAASFAFDKISEKQEAMAGLNIVQSNPFLLQQPKAQFEALKIALSTLGPRWKNFVDTLPSPEEFDQMMKQVAMQAVAKLFEAAKAQQGVTGVAPEVTPEQVTGAVKQAQQDAYNPALAAEREKAGAK